MTAHRHPPSRSTAWWVACGLGLLGGCEGNHPDRRGSEPVAVVDGVALDASVVRMIAARDGVDEPTARAQAIETLQLAAAARAERAATAQAEPEPLITAARRAQLLRAARARVWLDAVFLPPRRPADIPADDPMLARALSSSRYIHPRVHRVCQIVVVPVDVTEIDAARAITADPDWRARAHAVLDPLAERILRYVPASDPHACSLAGEVVPKLQASSGDPTLALRFESEGGFDLTACADPTPPSPGDACQTPQFDPPWTERVAATAPGQWTGVFEGGWGLHLAYVAGIEAARSADSPDDVAWIREQVHTGWLAKEWSTAVERLTQLRAVRVAGEPAAGQGDR